jgi:hypothetical protein
VPRLQVSSQGIIICTIEIVCNMTTGTPVSNLWHTPKARLSSVCQGIDSIGGGNDLQKLCTLPSLPAGRSIQVRWGATTTSACIVDDCPGGERHGCGSCAYTVDQVTCLADRHDQSTVHTPPAYHATNKTVGGRNPPLHSCILLERGDSQVKPEQHSPPCFSAPPGLTCHWSQGQPRVGK